MMVEFVGFVSLGLLHDIEALLSLGERENEKEKDDCKDGGREIPRSTIDQAESLAAYYSQGRGNTSVAVDYTLQRYVRHMKNGGPGMVIYERERTLHADPTAVASTTASAGH